MTEQHVLTGAYALDALDELERAAVRRHLATCAACTAEVREFREVGVRLAAALTVDPPAELRDRVLRDVRAIRQLPPDPRTSHRRRPGAVVRRVLAAGVAAAVLISTAVLGGVAWMSQQDARRDQVQAARQQERAAQQQELAARITTVVTDPDREQGTGRVLGGGSADIVTAGGNAVFAARDLPAPPSGRTYQLWVLQDGQPLARSAGLLDVTGGVTRAWVPSVPADAKLAVSVEPDGGSEQPTRGAVVVAVGTRTSS